MFKKTSNYRHLSASIGIRWAVDCYIIQVRLYGITEHRQIHVDPAPRLMQPKALQGFDL